MKRINRVKPLHFILLVILVIAGCEEDDNNAFRTPEEEQILGLSYDPVVTGTHTIETTFNPA